MLEKAKVDMEDKNAGCRMKLKEAWARRCFRIVVRRELRVRVWMGWTPYVRQPQTDAQAR